MPETPLPAQRLVLALERLGNQLIEMIHSIGNSLLLMVRALAWFRVLYKPIHFRKVVYQLFLCGVASIPVVTITALFSGMVLAGQTGVEMMRTFNDASKIGALVGVSMVREMGPVLASVVVAGFVGGGMASVIATMKVNEEVDALDVMGIDPVRYLVAPRLLAMMIAMPILVLFADWVGIMGGAVVSRYTLSVNYQVYFDECFVYMRFGDVLFGQIKALTFGIIITIVACNQGLKARGGAEGVGRATMRSVVYAFLLILIADYLLLEMIYQPFMRDW